MRLARVVPLLATSLWLLAACQSIKNPTQDWTAQRFYNEAQAALADDNYELAIERFEQLEARYPYGRYAEQAKLEVAYAHYKHSQPELAIQAADRFIRLHPTHPHVAYAYYLKGLIYMSEERGFTSFFKARSGDVYDRDPKSAQEAYRAFREVVERFPNSAYARDAGLRMSYLHNALANYEVSVARFYIRQEAYVAAVNRCKYVIENHQQAPAIEEALALQAQAYRHMGLTGLMQDTLRVLAQNFPNSSYLAQQDGASGDKRKKSASKKQKQKAAKQ